MTASYNKEKGLDKRPESDRHTVISAKRYPDSNVVADIQETPNEARLRWQREVSPKSFHSSIIGSAKNHRQVTAYDVAIGSGKASSDPRFYAYLCAVADWRVKSPKSNDKPREGILLVQDFRTLHAVYLAAEPPWRTAVINGNIDYYNSGILPAGLPLLSGGLWKIVISQTKNLKIVTENPVKNKQGYRSMQCYSKVMIMMLRLFWFLSVVLVLIAGVWWISSAAKSGPRQQITQKLPAETNTKSGEQAQREYVLEVSGLGVTLDKYRQGKLWDALQQGGPFTTIREQDPKKYPWTGTDKNGRGGTRAYDALENGINFTPICWGMPSFYAGTPILDPAKQPSPADPMAGLVAGAATGGLPMHLFSIASWKLDEHPDDLLNEVFAFFDAHPDVPYVVVHSEDSVGTRDGNRKPGEDRKLKDGYYIPDMPDATAVFILARRERVRSMQPYVWDDPENKFVNEQLRAMYFDLMNSLASPPDSRWSNLPVTRQPTVPEWLAAAAKFAQRPDVRGVGLYQFNAINPWIDRPPQTWKPTPWFPIPWNREQMATFDRLPSFGFVHRPVFVKFADENGKPVTRRDERQKIFNAGWQKALQTLPEAERAKGAARIVAATGKQPAQQLMLEGMLHDYAAQGGPEIDSGKTAQFINTDHRLGNTGAATFFVQMAIGVMGSYRDGGASAAINLRDRNEASIIFITPPSDAVRKEQEPRDIFRSRVTPAVDPANYAAPSVESLLESQATK